MLSGGGLPKKIIDFLHLKTVSLLILFTCVGLVQPFPEILKCFSGPVWTATISWREIIGTVFAFAFSSLEYVRLR